MSESEVTDPDQRNAIITTITLDLSNKHLKEIPKTIKNFSNIEFLYLSTNDIKAIPDFFFSCLPQLKWLDFRHNLLCALPTTIGQHRELRTLLLQGNKIESLPIELGNVPTITGLNIADNPLQFPPQSVLQEGTQKILKYLRVQLHNSNLLIPELEEQLEELQITENGGYLGSGDIEIHNTVSAPVFKKYNRNKNKLSDSPLSHKSAKLVPRTQDRRLSSSDPMITTKPRLPKAQKRFKSQTTSARMPHSDYYIKKAMEDFEEKRMQAIKKEENSRTDMMIQRMRDREALKIWRQQTFTHGTSTAENTIDGMDGGKSQVFLKNNCLDTIRPLRQKTVAMTDKEAELRRKIKEHASKLKDYHRPRPNTKEDSVINLQESQIQGDVRQLNQEYRFKAFTGEI